MALSGIRRIDELLADARATPLQRGDADRDAVGALQDLLNGHGARLPRILDESHGVFGPQTEAAVLAFQRDHGQQPTGTVDRATLQQLVTEPAISPSTSQAYLTLVLDIPWTGFTRVVSLTAQFESAGKFTALNRNTDRAGLSFGIIQWAQKPGRLNEILRAFNRTQAERFIQVLGGGRIATAAGLLTHTAKPNGGVNAAGVTLDPSFDLINDLWKERFLEAGRDRVWQKAQVSEAVAAFQRSFDGIRAVAPTARSERAVAFLLDVANQHGDGGLRSICAKCATPGVPEPQFLEAVENESVRRLRAQFGDTSSEAQSTLERRERFRTSPLLSDNALF